MNTQKAGTGEDEIFAAFTTYQYMGETVEGQAEHGTLASVDYTYDLIADEEAFLTGSDDFWANHQ